MILHFGFDQNLKYLHIIPKRQLRFNYNSLELDENPNYYLFRKFYKIQLYRLFVANVFEEIIFIKSRMNRR